MVFISLEDENKARSDEMMISRKKSWLAKQQQKVQKVQNLHTHT